MGVWWGERPRPPEFNERGKMVTKAIKDMKLNHWQKLLTAAQARALPALYAQDGKGFNATVHVKFFAGGMTWLATEFDPQEGMFFGLVVNHADPRFSELGYFSAAELSSRQVPSIRKLGGNSFQMIPVVERDLHFQPTTLAAAFKSLVGFDHPSAKPAAVIDSQEAAAVAAFN